MYVRPSVLSIVLCINVRLILACVLVCLCACLWLSFYLIVCPPVSLHVFINLCVCFYLFVSSFICPSVCMQFFCVRLFYILSGLYICLSFLRLIVWFRPYVCLSVRPIKCVYVSLMRVCMSVTFLISNVLLQTSYILRLCSYF